MFKPLKFISRLAPLFFFAAAALLLAAPALFSGGRLVCADDRPDTWNHLWTFWRFGHALAGGDLGFLRSHLLTYPGWVREPMAVFDPLLPLLATALRPALGLVGAYNLLVFAGLAFTAWAAFLLASKITGERHAAVIAGIAAAFNPFVYRQVAAGYAEYAWWGWVPLCVWLCLRAATAEKWKPAAAYAAGLAGAALTSMFCAACAAVAAAWFMFCEAALALRRRPNRLRRMLAIHVFCGLCLSPLLVFWGLQIRALRAEGMETAGGSPLATLANGEPPREERQNGVVPPLEDPSPQYLAWRALRGAFDIGEFFSLRRAVVAQEIEFRVNSQPLPRQWPWMREARVELAFLLELLPVLLLCMIGFGSAMRGADRWRWAGLAAAAVVLAFGYHPVWRGNVFSGLTLPYGLLSRALPAFGRLFGVPSRLLLLAIMACAVSAASGAAALACRFRLLPAARRSAMPFYVAAVALYAWFAFAGWGFQHKLAAPVDVPAVYSRIAAAGRRAAVLELPLAGDMDRYMLYQTVHGMPFFRGAPAVFPVKVHDEMGIRSNALVAACEAYPCAFSENEKVYRDAVKKLAKLGFGYIILHCDEKRPALFRQARDALAEFIGPACSADENIAAWAISGSLPQKQNKK